VNIPFKSIRLRLTLWYAAVLTALILLFSGVLYRFVDVRLKHLMKEDLETDLENVEKVIREGPDEIREYGVNFPAQLFRVAGPGRLRWIFFGQKNARPDRIDGRQGEGNHGGTSRGTSARHESG
jgi:hypothetical protein